MAEYSVNDAAVKKAKDLIDKRQYVVDGNWQDAQPSADDENAFLEAHGWDAYAEWCLAVTEGATEETKARYDFVYGDFRRVHRTAVDRVRLPSIRMEPQGGRVGGPRSAPALGRSTVVARGRSAFKARSACR